MHNSLYILKFTSQFLVLFPHCLLFYIAHLLQICKFAFGCHKGAVCSSGSAVQAIRAAEPVCLWTAATWADCLTWSTLLLGSHVGQLVSGGKEGTVCSSGSTVQAIRAAEPVCLRTAATRAGCLTWSTLPKKQQTVGWAIIFLRLMTYLLFICSLMSSSDDDLPVVQLQPDVEL